MRSTLLTILGFLAATCTYGQPSFTISGGDISTCTGYLWDSGGEASTGYLDNENYTMTICPDGSGGTSISLDFSLAFSLSDAGSDPLDQLSIYDGDNVNAPLIYSFNATNVPTVVSASFGNTSGCLTLNFTSNEAGTGAFLALISCYTPCEPPVAIATMGMSSPALVCIGEEITFDASASTVSTGNSIAEYRWNFVDGTVDSLSGAVVTHAYEVPGAYTVRLLLTDNSTNECTSTNPIDLQVLVDTRPDFTALTLDTVTICLGESVPLSAVGVEAVTWSGAPVVDFGGPVYLPDNLLTPFISSIDFTGFLPGATLQNVDLLESICVSMEHSYMGDTDLILICPNGQQVYMHEYAAGTSGTNTFIGDPLDDDAQAGVPGICFDYCWTSNAPNGTFDESSTNGISPNVQPSTISPGGNSLIPGDYTSEQPLSQLVGCPLNGTWTFQVVDHLGSDDGNICSWGVTFDASLYPDLTVFTPILGVNDLDSASWSGNGVATDPQTPLLAVATPTAEGTFEYVFTVIDNFGCAHDTSMTIVVNPGVPAPILITGDALVCEGALAYLSAPAGFTTYTWSNGSVGQNISTQVGGELTVTVGLGDCTLESEPFTVGQSPSPVPIVTGPSSGCGGGASTLTTTEQYATYAWSNGSTDPSISVGTGTYSVIVTAIGSNCSGASAPYPVTVGSDPQANFSVAPPSPQGIGTTATFTDASTGNGSPLTEWAWEFGNTGQGSSSPSTSYTFNTPGNYNITLTITAADGCQDTLTIPYIILPEQIIIPNVFTPNGDANNEYFVIENGQYFSNTLAVYNRWGQAVFDAKNYRNTWRAADVVDGTYYYVFTTLEDNKEYTGHVTILR